MQSCHQIKKHLPSKRLLRDYYRIEANSILVSDHTNIASEDMFHIEDCQVPSHVNRLKSAREFDGRDHVPTGTTSPRVNYDDVCASLFL